MFIAFEGIEGCGKSTQAVRLAHAFEAAGIEVCFTREPGGTPLGEAVRSILLSRTDYDILGITEAFLVSAARAQHVARVIEPALSRGAMVISDRFAGSTVAYQGGGRGVDLDALRELQRIATGGLMPDLTILVDVPVEIGLGRRYAAGEELNRIDVAERTFHDRVYHAYHEQAASNADSWIVVDGTQPIDTIAASVFALVAQRTGLKLAASSGSEG